MHLPYSTLVHVVVMRRCWNYEAQVSHIHHNYWNYFVGGTLRFVLLSKIPCTEFYLPQNDAICSAILFTHHKNVSAQFKHNTIQHTLFGKMHVMNGNTLATLNANATIT